MTIARPPAADVLTAVLGPAVPKAGATHGEPHESFLVLFEDDRVEVGIWEVTAGGFSSRKAGISEVMHFVAGEGSITADDGVVTEIRPGAVLVTPDGWEGTWEVSRPTRKLYVIAKTALPTDATPR